MSKTANNYEFDDTFYIRTPTLPIDFYYDLVDQDEISDEQFLEIWKMPIVREAIYVASPDFYDVMEQWAGSELKKKKRIDGVRSKFLSYLIRMSTRCTPFGLFAGVGMGTFGYEDKIVKAPLEEQKRVTRLDMHFLSNIFDHVADLPNVKEKAKYKFNDSLYKVRDHYRYMRYVKDKELRVYNIHGIKSTGYLEDIINGTKEYKSFADIVDILVSQGFSEDESKNYVFKLISAQILTSEISPVVCPGNNLQSLIKTLEKYEIKEKIIVDLIEIEKKISNIDQSFHNENIASYTEIKRVCENLNIKYNEKNLLQVDSFNKLNYGSLNKKYAYQTLRAANLLYKISNKSENEKLKNFQDNFTKRYEQEEVSLNDVLDVDIGIGYGNTTAWNSSTLLNKILSPANSKRGDTVEDKIRENQFLGFPLSMRQIHLKDLMPNIEGKEDINLGKTFYALVELYEENDVILIHPKSISYSSSKLLVRFSHLDTDFNEAIQKMIDIENNDQEKIYAEIIHLPQTRTGNVLTRDLSRHYEIPYLCKSANPESGQISVDDIYISLQNNKIVLRSKKLNKEIIPRNTTAHNYNIGSLPIYHFLSDVQSEYHRSSVYFNFNAFANLNYTPRVVHNNIILRKAKWIFTNHHVDELECILKSKDISKNISKWKDKYSLPRHCLIGHHDNLIPIKLRNLTCLRLFFDKLKIEKKVVVTEFISPAEIVTDDAQNRFTNEFIFTYKRV